MQRRLIWLFLIVLAAVAVVTLGVVAGQGEPDPIRVGAVYNRTGGMKWIDLPGVEGLLLAADQINAEGGVLGRHVEVVEVDGTTDTTEITRLASDLAEIDDIVAIAGVNDPIHAISPIRGALRRADGGLITFAHSEMALAVGQVTEPAGVPFVTAGSTLSTLPDLIGDDLFMVAATHGAHAAAAADYAWDELGARRAWILADDGREFTTSLAASFEHRWRERGGEMAGADSYRPGELEISTQIGRLGELATQPEVILIASLQNEGGYLIEQLRAAGMTQPIVLADVVDPRYIVAFAGDMSNVHMSTHGSLVDSGEAVDHFEIAYQAEYGQAPESPSAMLGYDTMRLIADAIERAGSTERDHVSQSLAQTDGFAALTGRLSYPDATHVPAKTITIVTYAGGEPMVAAEIDPR